ITVFTFARLDRHLHSFPTRRSSDLIDHLAVVDGILIPGGFGGRGIEGKITAVRYARERRVPFLGICLGMQVAVVEYARNVCGLRSEEHTSELQSRENIVCRLLLEKK